MIVWWPRHGWYRIEEDGWLSGPVDPVTGLAAPGYVACGAGFAAQRVLMHLNGTDTVLYPWRDDSDRQDPSRSVWVIEGAD